MSLQKHIGLLVFILVFVFSHNSQLSFSSSNVTLPNDSHLMLCHPLQSQALLRFKSNFVIDSSAFSCDENHPKTESWKEGTDCCSSWNGVSCDEVTGRVIELDLSCSQLVGTIDSNNSLFSTHIAPYLQRLNLAFNDFQDSDMSSPFFASLGSSTLTHLNLSWSVFTGIIPCEISLLTNLASLDLSFNDGLGFESDGVLENIARNLTHLSVLNLDQVDMSSVHTSSLMNLSSSITSVHLNGCQLQGKIPVTFLLRHNLKELDLSYNYISFLPDHFHTTTPNSSNLLLLDLSDINFLVSSSSRFLEFVGDNLESLRYLGLRNCNIRGSIPASLGNLKKLTFLDLQGNHLSGLIPPSFGNLLELTNLVLSVNHLSGTIPTSFSNLQNLAYFDLSDNELEGPLPPYLFSLPSLNIVSLFNNKLHGQISTSPVKSMNLTHLSLYNNNLSGSLDFDVLFSLTNLVFLDLSNNKISLSTSASSNINVNHSLPMLKVFLLSHCDLNQFPTFIKALTNLIVFDVSNNKIEGSVPNWIHDVGEYTMSTVNLSGNSLTSIGHPLRWRNIKSIDFHSNLLQGPLPIPSKTTTFFSVSNNLLSGEISSSICDLSGLDVFDLSRNQFTGLIPQCLGSLSSLSVLNLGVNNLHGVIPNTFKKYSNLNYLVLNRNKLSGSIPRSLAYCQNLQIMDVGNNMFEDIIPHWLEALSKLEVLVLRSNNFFGSLNNFKAKLSFPNLRILDISINNFTGKLPHKFFKNLNAMMNVNEKLEDGNLYMAPRSSDSDQDYYSMVIVVKGFETEYEKILTTFAAIDLSGNKFEGHIPKVIGKLISLRGLNLSHNALTGHIPPSMGDLASLEWLDLSSNKVNGQIPGELTDMSFLAVLNLSHNRLEGPIPQGKQFNTFGNDSYKDNLALCGFPLSNVCGSNHEPPSKNKDVSNSKIEFSWQGAVIGYGFGIVYGLYMGCLLVKSGALKWLVGMAEGKQRQGRAA